MSLYLCIFDDDEEIDGVEIGAYSDFATFRRVIAEQLESHRPGSRFPILMLHSDCDGEWTVEDCESLQNELDAIVTELKNLPARDFFTEWQKNVAKKHGIKPANLYECFIDIDGEPMFDRLGDLVKLARRKKLPILFQ
jgi:hypothetical protein